VMDGQRAGDLLRARGYRGPVVGLVDAEACDRTTFGSCDDVIVKPFEMAALVATIGGHRRSDREPLANRATPGV